MDLLPIFHRPEAASPPLATLPIMAGSVPPAPSATPSAVAPGAPIGTREIPVSQFLGDIVILASQVVNIPIQRLINGKCSGFKLVNVNGQVQVSINGGGLQTITGSCALTGADVVQLQVQTGPLSSVIVQLEGV